MTAADESRIWRMGISLEFSDANTGQRAEASHFNQVSAFQKSCFLGTRSFMEWDADNLRLGTYGIEQSEHSGRVDPFNKSHGQA
jgi:hypothetical protein